MVVTHDVSKPHSTTTVFWLTLLLPVKIPSSASHAAFRMASFSINLPWFQPWHPCHYGRSLPSWHLTNKQTNTIIQQQMVRKKYKLPIKKLFPLLPHLLKKLAFLLNILPLKSLLLWSSRKLTARGLIQQAQLGIQFGSINKAIVFVWSVPIQHNNMAIIYTGESIHL